MRKAIAVDIKPREGNKNVGVLREIKARVVEVAKRVDRAAPGLSQKVPEDPLAGLSAAGHAIEPPFDLLTLALLVENNTELGQCVEAMEVNIDSFGHRFVSRIVDSPDVDPALKKAVRTERVRLENFFSYATRESFVRFRRKLRKDIELTGNAYFEIVRNVADRIQAFNHIPSYQCRLGRLEDKQTLVKRPVLEMQEDGSVNVFQMPEFRRYRRYVQSKAVFLRNLSTLHGHKIRWFKEFGDPRIYNNETGEISDETLPREKRANEIMHLSIYSARSPYGLPRFIGNLLSIYGDRAAEEINYTTFQNNNIPSMALLVSNGQLTEGTIQRIESFVESQIQGSQNYSKFLILEVEGAEEGEDGGQVKIEIKPLVAEQHTDALFQQYSKNNQDKVRRSFRMPPILVGLSADYSRSVADSSIKIADEQIFAPERDEWDALFNRVFFPAMGIIYHRYKSNSPNTTDNTELVKILAGSEKTGGMTPRIARDLLEDILSRELPPFPEDFPADVPFSQTMAEAVKNKADPTEPGQQVTALKSSAFGELDPEAELYDAECVKCGNVGLVSNIDKADDAMLDRVVAINKRFEEKWRKEGLGDEVD